ncbi:MAG TPA: hypothetical protein DCE58_04645 [Cryomorphaceae bacterium]|nr:hypothetical protein [Cryomorphaceae bacterium]
MWPATWAFFPKTESSPEDSVVLMSFGAQGVHFVAIHTKSAKPLGAPLTLSLEQAQSWRQASAHSFAAVHVFSEESFAAWFPADWVDTPETWLKPLDPEGSGWECYRLERGMDLYYRVPSSTPAEAQPLMALNAMRWLSPLAKRDAIHVYRLGQRLEIAAIQNGRLLAHNLFDAQSSQDAAYACMLFYDQCHLPAQHVPLIWEGDADEPCWESLRPFVEKIDTSASHPWSALTVLAPSH